MMCVLTMRGVGADDNPRIVGTDFHPFLHDKPRHYFRMGETQVRSAMKRFM